MEIPIVSVILPCYNAQDFIVDAIFSIKNQTLQSWELIIVDDCSTDGSIEKIMPLLDHRTLLLKQSQNGGYPMAMNKGISQARGKYIARMDADDICLPKRLQEQLEALKRYPEASLCGLNRFRITPGGKMYVDRDSPPQKYVLETWENLMQNRRLFTDPSVLLEKEKVVAVGSYRTFQRSGMDVDLWLRVMERYGPCVTITTPLFGKRLEPGSIVFNPKTFMMNQVPRVLARQRLERGTDDVQDGKPVIVDEYVQQGWIVEDGEQAKTHLLLGAIVTCIWLRDRRGAGIYWSQIIKLSSPDFIFRFKMVLSVVRKLLQRMLNNPYKKLTNPV